MFYVIVGTSRLGPNSHSRGIGTTRCPILRRTKMPVLDYHWNGYIGLKRPPIFQTDSQTRLWNNKVHPPQDVAQGGGFITGFEVFQGGTQYFKEGPRSGKAKGGLGGGGAAAWG